MNDQIDQFVEHLTNQQHNLYAYIMTLLPRVQDADEVLQETNKVIWMKREDFREGTNFRAWAFSIARYQVLAHRKRQHQNHRLLSLDLVGQLADENNASPKFSEGLLKILAHCMSKLSASKRSLLEMRYTTGLTAPQIAEKTDRSAVAVRQSLFTIRKDLVRCMNDSLDGRGESP